jgi:branched-chain amino acid transport system ATP-binding protein
MSSASNSVVFRFETITKRFGGVMALHEVNLNVEACRIIGLIGPNGAVRTTLLNAISSIIYPSKGGI